MAHLLVLWAWSYFSEPIPYDPSEALQLRPLLAALTEPHLNQS